MRTFKPFQFSLCKPGSVGVFLAVSIVFSSLCLPCLAQSEPDAHAGQQAPADPVAQADAAYAESEYPMAEHLYLRALAALGDVRDSTYVELLTKLGNCYYLAGKFDLAEAIFRRAIKADEDLHGKESLEVANDLFNVTRSLRRQYHWDEAQPLIERTIKIRQKVLGEDDLLVAMSWADLAVNFQRQGKFSDSESAFQKTIAIRERLNDGGKSAAIAYFLYARLLRDMNRPAEAEVWEQRYKQTGIRL